MYERMRRPIRERMLGLGNALPTLWNFRPYFFDFRALRVFGFSRSVKPSRTQSNQYRSNLGGCIRFSPMIRLLLYQGDPLPTILEARRAEAICPGFGPGRRLNLLRSRLRCGTVGRGKFFQAGELAKNSGHKERVVLEIAFPQSPRFAAQTEKPLQ